MRHPTRPRAKTDGDTTTFFTAARVRTTVTATQRSPAAVAGVVAVALLVCIALAFAFVPFHVGAGQTAAHSAVGTAVAGNATSDFHGRVYLYAAGPASGPVADGVADRLDRADVTVERLETLNGSHDRPVLALRVNRVEVAWNPVTPSAATAVAFAYVASGNGTLADRALRNQSLALSSRGDRYVVHGVVGLRHAGTGVYSLPGYRRLVYDRTAAEVAGAIRNGTRE